MKHFSIISLLFLACFTQMKAQVSADAGQDREICIFDSLKVKGSGLKSGDTGTYQWKDIGSGLTLSTNEDLVVKIIIQANKSYQLRVQRTSNGQTYTAYDTFQLIVNPLPTFIYGGIPPICYNDGAVPLTTDIVAIAKSGYDPNVRDSALRYFQNRIPSWISGGPKGVNPYKYDYPKFILNSQIPSSGARDTICYDYTDAKGCYSKECKAVRLYPSPVVEFSQGIFCQQNGPVNLSAQVIKPLNKTGGVESYRCLSVPSGSGLNKDSVIKLNTTLIPNIYELKIGNANQPKNAGDYIIEYCFKNSITSCQTCDTSIIHVVKLPVLKLSKWNNSCINHSKLDLDSFVKDSATGKYLIASKWSCVEFSGSRNRGVPSVREKLDSSVIGGRYFTPEYGGGSYLLKVEELSSGCGVSDSASILVYGLPIVQINIPDTVCANANFQLVNVVPPGNVGTWSGSGVSGNMFDASISPQTSNYHGPYSVKFKYQNPLTKCENSDSDKIFIRSLPKITGQYDLIRGSAFDVDFSISSFQFLDTTKDKCLWVFGNGDSARNYHPGRIHFKDSGIQTIIIYTQNGGCEKSDTLRFLLDSKITSVHKDQLDIELFPNPADNFLFIKLVQDAAITIYDLNGRKIMFETIKAQTEKCLNVAELPSGLYLMQIEAGDTLVWKRLVIE